LGKSFFEEVRNAQHIRASLKNNHQILLGFPGSTTTKIYLDNDVDSAITINSSSKKGYINVLIPLGETEGYMLNLPNNESSILKINKLLLGVLPSKTNSKNLSKEDIIGNLRRSIEEFEENFNSNQFQRIQKLEYSEVGSKKHTITLGMQGMTLNICGENLTEEASQRIDSLFKKLNEKLNSKTSDSSENIDKNSEIATVLNDLLKISNISKINLKLGAFDVNLEPSEDELLVTSKITYGEQGMLTCKSKTSSNGRERNIDNLLYNIFNISETNNSNLMAIQDLISSEFTEELSYKGKDGNTFVIQNAEESFNIGYGSNLIGTWEINKYFTSPEYEGYTPVQIFSRNLIDAFNGELSSGKLTAIYGSFTSVAGRSKR
jgi:hypothetical protein